MFWWCCERGKRSLYLYYKVNIRLLKDADKNHADRVHRQELYWIELQTIARMVSLSFQSYSQNMKQTRQMRLKFGVTEWLALTIDKHDSMT